MTKETAADRMLAQQAEALANIEIIEQMLEDTLASFQEGGSVCYGHVGDIARINECLRAAIPEQEEGE